MKKEEQLAPRLDPDSQVGVGSREPEILNGNHRLQLRYTFQCMSDRAQIAADLEQLKIASGNKPNDSTIAEFPARR
jgi:hypothetical protein